MEIRAVLIEISMLCWNLPSGPKHRGSRQKKYGWTKTPGSSQKKIWLSLKKGISCFQVILVLIWIKQTLILFKLQRNGNGNELFNIKDSFTECLQLQMSFHKGMHLQKYTKVCASSRMVSQVSHTIAEQNIKEKYLIC